MPKTNTHNTQKNTPLVPPKDVDRSFLEGLPKDQLITIVLEQHKLIVQLQSAVAELQVRLAALGKDSSNSSKPSSTDQPGTGNNAAHRRRLNSRQASDRLSGGQPGHLGTTRIQVETPDRVIICAPTACEACGHELPAVGHQLIAVTQVVDIPPIVPIVTEYQQIACQCRCGYISNGSLPVHVTASDGGIQIGPNASSFLVYLSSAHHLPYARLRQLSCDLFNLSLSEGTIANKLELAGQVASPLQDTILSFLHTSPWVGGDETGITVGHERWWEWVWQNTKASLYIMSPCRDYQTVKDHFGENYQGTFVHDCYSAQNNTIAGAGHQLCHAHLLRDLQFLVDTGESPAWAYRMYRLLVRAQKAQSALWDGAGDTPEADHIRQAGRHYYERQLDHLCEVAVNGKTALRLQKRFRKHRDKIFLFLSSPDIPPDNNGSERAIRNAKIKQKVSGGYRSERGAQRQAVLLSVIETAKKQRLNILETIRKLFTGERVVLFGG